MEIYMTLSTLEVLKDMNIVFPNLRVFHKNMKEFEEFDLYEGEITELRPYYSVNGCSNKYTLYIENFWQIFMIHKISIPKWFAEKYTVRELFNQEIHRFGFNGVIRINRENDGTCIYETDKFKELFEDLFEA